MYPLRKFFSKLFRFLAEVPRFFCSIRCGRRNIDYILPIEGHYFMRKLHLLTGGYSSEWLVRYMYPGAKRKDCFTEGYRYLGNTGNSLANERLKSLGCYKKKFGDKKTANFSSLDDVLRNNPGAARVEISQEQLFADENLAHLILDQKWVKVVYDILGTEPCAVNISAWWSLPSDKGEAEMDAAAQMWHRDIDHLREIKIFIFATDIKAENGPFQFVKGTHLPSIAFSTHIDGRRKHNEVLEKFKSFEFISATGKAGDAYIFDTQGLHRGCPVSSGRRLVLQLHFSHSLFGIEVLSRPRIALKPEWPSYAIWRNAVQMKPNTWRFLFDSNSLPDK